MTTVQAAAAVLEAAGVPSAVHDARVLIEYAAATGARLDELLEQRARRIPLQHLLGTTGFRHLVLFVGPGVFVPRPETELLVDAVLDSLRTEPTSSRPRVVDLCAGSGAIGLSVAYEHPAVTVDLVECSAEAMPWLLRNASGRDRVTVHHADLADAPSGAAGMIDVVVSNPPYIPLDECNLMEPEVLDHDPSDALWGGDDGLAVIRRVVARGAELLRPGGLLVMEHSDRQGESAPAVAEAAGFIDVADHQDLTGRDRYLTGVWPC